MLAPNRAPRPISPLRQILLIEAEPMLRSTVTSFLERAGHQVTDCAEPLDALRLLEKHAARPAVVVFSTRWLDVAAIQAGCRLRELAPRSPLLWVADAIDLEAVRTLPLPPGMRILAHPFDMPDLIGAVRSAIRATAPGPSRSAAGARLA
jgi:DNA-binding response OmpR family regulator